MKKQYEFLKMTVCLVYNDVITTSTPITEPQYGTDGQDDFGYDFWA